MPKKNLEELKELVLKEGIDLYEKSIAESLEITSGIVVDFDENNNIVGIDIDHASKILNLSDLDITSVLTKKLVLASPT